jgi:hypothetical protein
LLLDVRRFSAPPILAFFDQQLAVGDPISRVFTNPSIPGGVNSPVGVADSRGLVTQFHATAVPEPAALVLFGVGGVLLGCMRLRRRDSHRCGHQTPATAVSEVDVGRVRG